MYNFKEMSHERLVEVATELHVENEARAKKIAELEEKLEAREVMAKSLAESMAERLPDYFIERSAMTGQVIPGTVRVAVSCASCVHSGRTSCPCVISPPNMICSAYRCCV